MNERQAFTAIRNMLRLEREAAGAVQKVTPEIRRAFEFLRLQIEEMPTGQLEREMWFKATRQQFNGAFRDANARMYQEVQQALEDNVVDQYNWGEKYLRDGGVSVSPPVGEGTVGFSAQTQVPTRTQLQAITQDTEVLGKRLDELFSAGPSGVSPWTATQVDRIDRVVKQGFLLSETNEEIARNLSGALNQSLAESRAIARTAVMDMSQRAHNEFWDANDSVIAGWEFDASMDYRVCPQCAPNDGRTAKKRHELPQTPVHPNCRCMVLPLTETELALREKEGPQRRSVVELVEAGSKEEAERIAKDKFQATRTKAYAKQVKVNGKKYWRVAADVERGNRPLTMGEFVREASPATQRNVLGSEKAAARFRKLSSPAKGNKGALSPDAALAEVTKAQRAPFKKGTRSALQSPAVRKIKKSSPPSAPQAAPVKKAAAPKPAPKPKPKPPSPVRAVAKPKAAPKPKAVVPKPKAVVPKPAPAPKPQTPVQKAATDKAAAVLAKAKKETTFKDWIPTAELDAMMTAGKPSPVGKLYDIKGVNPAPLFLDNHKNKLGSGAFGSAVLAPEGVVKRGMLTPNEVKALERLSGTGYTPKLLGVAYEDAKASRKTFGAITTRKGFLLMEKGAGKTLTSMKLTNEQSLQAFDELIRARKAIHLNGIAHQDMHPGNVMFDVASGRMTILDLGLARLDSRSALVEALGTRRGKMDPFGPKPLQPGDYQSNATFRLLNPGGKVAGKSEALKRLKANRKKVEAELAAEGLGEVFANASIRKLPSSITKGITQERALELLKMLYEGI